MTVFLTGASGYLGKHILTVLNQRDINCIALSRQPAVEPGFIQGDLLTISSYIDALSECDTVIHAAGHVSHKM